jgi:hypothetical protein
MPTSRQEKNRKERELRKGEQGDAIRLRDRIRKQRSRIFSEDYSYFIQCLRSALGKDPYPSLDH